MKVGSLSKPVETGLKNLNTKVESIVLSGTERRPAQTRKRSKSMLVNSVTLKMLEVISPSDWLIIEKDA